MFGLNKRLRKIERELLELKKPFLFEIGDVVRVSGKYDEEWIIASKEKVYYEYSKEVYNYYVLAKEGVKVKIEQSESFLIKIR
jgi:hypothetical protein